MLLPIASRPPSISSSLNPAGKTSSCDLCPSSSSNKAAAFVRASSKISRGSFPSIIPFYDILATSAITTTCLPTPQSTTRSHLVIEIRTVISYRRGLHGLRRH